MLFSVPALSAMDIQVVAKIEKARSDLNIWLQGVPRRWTGLLRRSTLGRVIRASNSIEGYVIPKDDVVAAAEGESVDANEATQQATAAYRRAMTHVLGLAKDPTFEWSPAVIKALHFMMVEYDLDKLPGQWRDGPVYVVDEKQHPVYEGPDDGLVAPLMAEFIEGLRAQAPDVPGIVRAAMAHLNLVMIHPFKDGNGRMARCIQTLVLGRAGTLEPVFSSIEEYLGRHTGPYYDILADVGRGTWHPEGDAQSWVRFCLRAHYYQAQTFLRRVREAESVMNMLEVTVRTAGLPERTRLALWDAANSYKVKNNTYRTAAGISNGLASRDLMELVRTGFLVPVGERKGRYYTASPLLLEIRQRAAEDRFIANPYEETQSPGVSFANPITLTIGPPPSSTGPLPPSGQSRPADPDREP